MKVFILLVLCCNFNIFPELLSEESLDDWLESTNISPKESNEENIDTLLEYSKILPEASNEKSLDDWIESSNIASEESQEDKIDTLLEYTKISPKKSNVQNIDTCLESNNISSKISNETKADTWLESLRMNNYIHLIEEELNNLFKSPENPEGIWKAIELNPRLTGFLFFLFNKSPRLSYLILYCLNPSIIMGVMQEETISIDVKMLIFPELVFVYKIYSLYFTAHTFFSIIYSISLVFLFFKNFQEFRNGNGKFEAYKIIIYSLICLILPINVIKLDIYTIGILSNFSFKIVDCLFCCFYSQSLISKLHH